MKLALVVQRYGLEVNGGAERLCCMLAKQLSSPHQVTVLTSCAIDYQTWCNKYPSGSTEVDGISVLRFPVQEQRDKEKFDSLTFKILQGQGSLEEQEEWVRQQGPYTPALLEYIGTHAGNYDAFVFFTYLYYPTVYGLPLVKEKALLVPLAHDEPPIYLRVYEAVFGAPRALMFVSPEEEEFVHRRFPALSQPNTLIAIAPEVAEIADEVTFWARYGERIGTRHFLLYVGRIEEGKGCDELVSFFERYRAEEKVEDLKLVMIGRGQLSRSLPASVVPLGFVSEPDKWAAIEASRLLVIPSRYESLCLVALEAGRLGKAVLVNGRCPTLRGYCQRSQGGLWYENYDEFREALSQLLSQDSLVNRLGAQAQRYILTNYDRSQTQEIFHRFLCLFSRNEQSHTVK